MTTEPASDGANLDAATFDLDAWIDDVVRPEVTIDLYPNDDAYQIRVAQLEAQIPAAEKAGDGDRGVDDTTPTIAQLIAQLAELREERARTTLHVRVKQLTEVEQAAASKAAKAAGVADDDVATHNLWQIAAATVAPAFTADQLGRLRARDRSGEQLVTQLLTTVVALMAGLPVPS